jgi:hypothetical protein
MVFFVNVGAVLCLSRIKQSKNILEQLGQPQWLPLRLAQRLRHATLFTQHADKIFALFELHSAIKHLLHAD